MAVAERIYARALYEAAQGKGSLAAVRTQLAEFVEALEGADDLRAVLGDRETDSATKLAILDDVLEGADPLVRNFVLLLAEKGRAGEIGKAAAQFEVLVAAEDRVLEVELTTAHELAAADFKRIVGEIEKKSGRKVQATQTVVPGLIGGIVLQAGSMRLDASVRGRLDRLRQELATTRS